MTIKRYTFEIDDTPDPRSGTGAESQKQPVGGEEEKNQTRSVEAYKDVETSKTDSLSTSKPTVGRTLGDIVVEFKNDRRFMTVLLTLLSFVIFISKMDSFSNFPLPIGLAVLLNCLWHIFPFLEKKLTGRSTV